MKLNCFVIYILFLSLCSCVSTKINEKKDYATSIIDLASGHVDQALEDYPVKEKNHFITVVEKAYLRLLSNKNLEPKEFAELVKLAQQIESKEVVYLSNELQSLFYIETDEGYFPGEHELYWMHLVLGFHYLKNSDPVNARIHAQKVSELFSKVNYQGKKFFDDTSLRILSASLWIAVGEWDRAQVDLRNAIKIKPDLEGFNKMLEEKNPPRQWNLYFRGTGYQVTFDASKLENKFSGSSAVAFQTSITESKNTSGLQLIGTSQDWYTRHRYRNHEIKNVIDKSRYMSRMFKSELESGMLNVMTTATTGVVLTTGLALGIGLVGSGIYLASQVQGADEAIAYIIGLGFLVGTEIFNAGTSFFKETTGKISKEKLEYQDVSRFYRYVRFIPDEFYIGLNTLGNGVTPRSFLSYSNKYSTINLFYFN